MYCYFGLGELTELEDLFYSFSGFVYPVPIVAVPVVVFSVTSEFSGVGDFGFSVFKGVTECKLWGNGDLSVFCGIAYEVVFVYNAEQAVGQVVVAVVVLEDAVSFGAPEQPVEF